MSYSSNLLQNLGNLSSKLNTLGNVFSLGYNIANIPTNYGSYRHAQSQHISDLTQTIKAAETRFALIDTQDEINIELITQQALRASSTFKAVAAGSLGSLGDESRISLENEIQRSTDLLLREQMQKYSLEIDENENVYNQARNQKIQANKPWIQRTAEAALMYMGVDEEEFRGYGEQTKYKRRYGD